jgi:F0F1-type ATP synthase assembly protein I
MKQPQNEPFSLYMLAIGVVGQVGCLLTATVIGFLVLGFALDQVLGTKPLFIFVGVLASVPLNIWLMFQYTRRKTRNLQESVSVQHKEDEISE